MKILCGVRVSRHGFDTDISELVNKYKDADMVTNGISMEITLEKDSEDMKYIVNYAQKHSLDYFVSGDMYRFSEEECEKALYSTAGFFRADDWDEHCDDYGTKLECSCEMCKRNAIVVGPVHIPVKKFKQYKAFRLPPAFIVCKELKETFQNMKVTGCEFGNVIDIATDKISNEYFHLHVTAILPPISCETTTLYNCPACGADLLRPPSNAIYNRDGFSEQKDFYLSYETFFPLNHRTLHWLIVSNRVRMVLAEYTDVHTYPVYIPRLF